MLGGYVVPASGGEVRTVSRPSEMVPTNLRMGTAMRGILTVMSDAIIVEPKLYIVEDLVRLWMRWSAGGVTVGSS